MSRRESIIAISVLAAAALYADTASAQNDFLRPSITLEERFDDNVRFAGVASGGDNDLVSTATPQLKYLRDSVRTRIEAHYRLDANYHAMNPELNYLSHNAGADLNYELTKQTRLHIGDGFSYTKDSLQYMTTGIQLTRTNITSNTATIGAGTQLTRRTDASLSYTNHIQSFDDPALIDSTTHTVSLGSGYKYSSTGAARASYAYTAYDFGNNTESRSLGSHGITLGLSEKVTSSMKANLSGGAVYVPNLDGNDFLFVANAGLEQTYGDSVLSLLYSRQTTNPSGLSNEISVNDRVDFTWGHSVKKNLNFTVFGGLARNKSEPSGSVDVNSYNAGFKGAWQPYKWMTVGAGVTHFEQWAKDDLASSLRRNQIFLNITFTGPEWRF